MAHEINYNAKRKQHSFFSRQEKAWHGLGQLVDGYLTSEEAIKAANLDYEVIKCPIYAKFPTQGNIKDMNGEVISEMSQRGKVINNAFATVRKDTYHPFAVVGNKYTVVQNTDAFKFFDDVVGRKEAIFDTAGALGQGERIFITAKLPHDIRFVDKNDVIEQYLLLFNTHDGSGLIKVLFTPIRVVCNNTLNMALRSNTNCISIRHTKSVFDSLDKGRDLLRLHSVYTNEMLETAKFLASQPITDEIVFESITRLFLTPEEKQELLNVGGTLTDAPSISTRKRNIVVDALHSIQEAPGQEMYRGTKLWLYNGITSYVNNVKSFKDNEAKLDYVISDKNVGNLILTDLLLS